MTIHRLERSQFLSISIRRAWEFFSSPSNLDLITPPELGFEITGGAGTPIHEGQILTYRVRIAPGVRMVWVTEIKAVAEGVQFVDEQRFGPYKFWHHRHVFEETPDGVRMTDIVHYALPFGWIGGVAHLFFVRPKLERIFEYRRSKLTEWFGNTG